MKLPLSLLLAFATGLTALIAQDKPAPAESPKTADAKKEAISDPTVDIPIPLGLPVKGIKIPHYGVDNKLQMMFEAELATKLDDQRIEMENLNIDVYDADGSKFYIEIPHSIFNMTTRILAGDRGVSIRRSDFEIIGDAVEFHTKEKFGRILGKSKMTILSTEKLDQP